MMFSNLPSILPQIQAKTVTVLAVAGGARARALPDVPTVAEAAVPGFKASAWFGLVAPAKTPEDVTTKLIGDCQAILLLPSVQERLGAIGAEPGALFGEAFRSALAEERVTWSKIIADAGVKAGLSGDAVGSCRQGGRGHRRQPRYRPRDRRGVVGRGV